METSVSKVDSGTVEVLVMLVELSISTRIVIVGAGHGASSVLKSIAHSSQLDGEGLEAVLSALSRVSVKFPVLELFPTAGKGSS